MNQTSINLQVRYQIRRVEVWEAKSWKALGLKVCQYLKKVERTPMKPGKHGQGRRESIEFVVLEA